MSIRSSQASRRRSRIDETITIWMMCLGVLACGISHAATDDEDVPADATHEEITRLIDRLSSESFTDREAAKNRLIQIGPCARKLLAQVKMSPSPEVRSRVAAILKEIEERPLAESMQQFAEQPDDKLDLEEGMWLISRIVDPETTRETIAKSLDQLAEKVRARLGEAVDPRQADPQQVVEAVRKVLFDEERFTGNVDDYENPENSSLARVLATRKGLPILLSHVVVSVGQRLEIPLVGVPTPGRYIVKYDGKQAPAGFPREDIFLHPFDGGKVLSRQDRKNLFPGLDPDKLAEPSSGRFILIRMLVNLETHLFNASKSDAAYQALEFRKYLEQSAPRGETP